MARMEWDIRPVEGLGEIAFGAKPLDVEVLLGAFGHLERQRLTDPLESDDLFKHLVETLGEEEARAAMAVIANANIDTRTRLTRIYTSGLFLTFVADQLEEIMLDRRAIQGHFQRLLLFGTNPLPALQKLQHLNGGPPLLKGPDCYFDKIFVTAFECVLIDQMGRLRATIEGTDEARQKTVGWSAAPRNLHEDFSKHLRVDLIQN